MSILTAILIWRLIPKALAMPSNDDFRIKNEALLQTKQALLEANQLLERRVIKRTHELERIAKTDALTGILNRGGLMAELSKEAERATRYQNPLNLLMVDLDHFKDINDQYGHLHGDEVLVESAPNIIGCM